MNSWPSQFALALPMKAKAVAKDATVAQFTQDGCRADALTPRFISLQGKKKHSCVVWDNTLSLTISLIDPFVT